MPQHPAQAPAITLVDALVQRPRAPFEGALLPGGRRLEQLRAQDGSEREGDHA